MTAALVLLVVVSIVAVGYACYLRGFITGGMQRQASGSTSRVLDEMKATHDAAVAMIASGSSAASVASAPKRPAIAQPRVFRTVRDLVDAHNRGEDTRHAVVSGFGIVEPARMEALVAGYDVEPRTPERQWIGVV